MTQFAHGSLSRQYDGILSAVKEACCFESVKNVSDHYDLSPNCVWIEVRMTVAERGPFVAHIPVSAEILGEPVGVLAPVFSREMSHLIEAAISSEGEGCND